MKFSVVFQGWVVTSEGDLPSAREITDHFNNVMHELESLGFDDAKVDADTKHGRVEISVVVDAEGWEEAQKEGSDVIRTAAHAAGVATPNWSVDWCRVTIEKSRLVAA